MSMRNYAALVDYFAGRAERARSPDDRERFEQIAAAYRAMLRSEGPVNRTLIPASAKKPGITLPQERAP